MACVSADVHLVTTGFTTGFSTGFTAGVVTTGFCVRFIIWFSVGFIIWFSAHGLYVRYCIIFL